VTDYRTDDKSRLLANCTALTEQHFAIFRHLISSADCDFAMLVDLAPDRLHHAMLASILPEHPKFDPNGRFVDACRDYYAKLDREIERTVALGGPDTIIIIVSDHGVQPLEGGICVNDWLIEQGYLKLDEMPSEPTPLRNCRVDWSQTKAWGEGGHHCRICFNLKGREPRGIISPEHLPEEQEKLIRKIKQVSGPGGRPLENEVFAPKDSYARVNGFPPDLIVYWDELKLRAIGTVGHASTYTASNDTGDDEANHAKDGILIVSNGPVTKEAKDLRLEDLFATSLDALGIDLPKPGKGRSLLA
jgi:predicted AlkP superfamily phosphohydrolase/phosphomutase